MSKDKVEERIKQAKKDRRDAVKILKQQGKKIPKKIKERAEREAKDE